MKKCCNCGSTFSDRYDEKCDVCLGEHFNKEFAIGEKVRVNDNFNGVIVGTATIVRDGQLFHQYVVKSDIDFIAQGGVGLTDTIICHRDNIVSLYQEEKDG